MDPIRELINREVESLSGEERIIYDQHAKNYAAQVFASDILAHEFAFSFIVELRKEK